MHVRHDLAEHGGGDSTDSFDLFKQHLRVEGETVGEGDLETNDVPGGTINNYFEGKIPPPPARPTTTV